MGLFRLRVFSASKLLIAQLLLGGILSFSSSAFGQLNPATRPPEFKAVKPRFDRFEYLKYPHARRSAKPKKCVPHGLARCPISPASEPAYQNKYIDARRYDDGSNPWRP